MPNELREEDRRALLATAREAIAAELEARSPSWPPLGPDCGRESGAFVTLHKGGRLRGCIGRMEAVDALAEVVKAMARAAAFDDPRFRPLAAAELDEIDIEISALSPLEDCGPEDLIMGTHGAILSLGYAAGVFLPQVAPEQGWDRLTFLDQLCLKAGLPAGSWRDPKARLRRFSAEVFGEKP